MKKIFCFSLFLLSILNSCNSDGIYHKNDKNFEGNRWLNNDIKSHNFSINEDLNADFILRFSHVYDYQFGSVPIIVEIVYPDNTIEKLNFNLKLKDEKGGELGDCSGDYCDLDFTFISNRKLNKGNYKIKIGTNFSYGFLPNVLAVGLKVIPTKNRE